jgi:hypothetical protein
MSISGGIEGVSRRRIESIEKNNQVSASAYQRARLRWCFRIVVAKMARLAKMLASKKNNGSVAIMAASMWRNGGHQPAYESRRKAIHRSEKPAGVAAAAGMAWRFNNGGHGVISEWRSKA